MARKSERQALLESGEARGILRPEHAAELKSLRARQGGAGGGSAPAPKAQDLNQLGEAQTRAEAAGKTVRLYDNIAPVIERFKPGPLKGTAMGMVMPNADGGFFDNVGAVLGAPIRALIPGQTKSDYEKIDAAQSERVALRQMEQKGVQTAADATRYAKADISPNRSISTNRQIIRDGKTESYLVKLRSEIESRWVAKYGSKSRAAPDGRTFSQAVTIGEQSFLRRQKARRAPPSTRRASSGWSAEEIK